MDSLKGFIKNRSALNHRELAKLIDWSPSSFHQWLNDKRPIPKEKAKLLADVLSEYGFKPQMLNQRTEPFSFLFCAVGKILK